ncbi:phosphonate ABC transporter, permease protein PhnE [Devosia yakushimensis]|uniref:Phosphonate ABC transporter, permease protein PhnE n=1 Tax=Devosia yakushimensis TaxID=470028 RepID=A0ABQ5UH21_9HYPH|nr:phosphonate ABC transporter, permease protein PhnE [Devosia yakushimensis]GLQ10503.1 phosphonate ABC transporter, permease protein PhnE [Devosia yakushimensis]
MSVLTPAGGLRASTTQQERLLSFEGRYRREQSTRLFWTLGYALLFFAALLASINASDFSLPGLVKGLPMAWNYIAGTLPKLSIATFGADMADWYWGLNYWLRLLLETILMGFAGTVLGGLLALALCFPASRNLVANGSVYFIARRTLEFCRTVPELVFALIFVFAFGLGPFAGVLAIAVHTAGSLGKLFAEVNENVDPRPIEGVRAAGGNWPMVMRLAVVPQALPNYASYLLLRFEINVRGASALGIVGAGGIGQDLYVAIRQFEYTDISAIMLLLIATTSVIDILCEFIRHRLIGHDLTGSA